MKLSKKMGFASIVLGVALLTGCGTDTAKDGAPKTEASQNEVVEEVKDENIIPINQVVVDDNVIKATLVEIKTYEDDVWGMRRKVVFDVENKTEQDIIVQSEKVSSDGKMVKEEFIMMSDDISAGMMAESVLDIMPLDEEMPVLEKNFAMTIKVLSSDFDRIAEYQVSVDMPNKQ